VLLNANEVPHEAHQSRITECNERARAILERDRDKALKLIDRLVECGHVDDAEFERLMGAD
jgi:hypothetical protein